MIKTMVKIFLFFLFSILSFEVFANDLRKATIKKVSDGDTVQAYIDGELHKIRLLEIDCFETSNNKRAKLQSSYYGKNIGEVLRTGNRSKEILTNLLKANKDNVYIELTGKDVFQRDLGYIYIGNDRNNNINKYMMTDGLCVPYLSSAEMKRKYKNHNLTIDILNALN